MELRVLLAPDFVGSAAIDWVRTKGKNKRTCMMQALIIMALLTALQVAQDNLRACHKLKLQY